MQNQKKMTHVIDKYANSVHNTGYEKIGQKSKIIAHVIMIFQNSVHNTGYEKMAYIAMILKNGIRITIYEKKNKNWIHKRLSK